MTYSGSLFLKSLCHTWRRSPPRIAPRAVAAVLRYVPAVPAARRFGARAGPPDTAPSSRGAGAHPQREHGGAYSGDSVRWRASRSK